MFLRDRATLLNYRIRATNSKQCMQKDSATICPEIFLDAVSEKLSSMAVLFLNVELLSEFYYQVHLLHLLPDLSSHANWITDFSTHYPPKKCPVSRRRTPRSEITSS
jgi:hypothetical protein